MQINEKDKFSEEFILALSKVGFGSMNKTDYEILLFDLLRKHGNLKDKSNHQISLLLKVPETKINRLAYEADLKYSNYQDDDIAYKFFLIISKAKFRKDQNKIQFIIEDKYIKNTINAKLKDLGHFSDSSFNSEIVSVNVDSFIELLEIYYPKDFIKGIIKECKTIPKVREGDRFKVIMKKFFENIAAKSGDKVVEIGIKYFSKGSENITDIINYIN